MLANGCPKNRSELDASLTNAPQSVRHNRTRACIDHSGLALLLALIVALFVQLFLVGYC